MSRKHSLSIMFFICAYLLCINPLAAQEEEIETPQDTVYRVPGAALYLELFGKPFGSLNMDIRINKSSRFSLGIVFYTLYAGGSSYSRFSGGTKDENGEDQDVSELMPNIMYYYLAGEKIIDLRLGVALAFALFGTKI